MVQISMALGETPLVRSLKTSQAALVSADVRHMNPLHQKALFRNAEIIGNLAEFDHQQPD